MYQKKPQAARLSAACEETIRTAVDAAASREAISPAAFVRRAVIRELRQSGMIATAREGGSIREL